MVDINLAFSTLNELEDAANAISLGESISNAPETNASDKVDKGTQERRVKIFWKPQKLHSFRSKDGEMSYYVEWETITLQASNIITACHQAGKQVNEVIQVL